MRVATFNINNINKRLDNLLAWLAKAEPDVVSLQELKAEQDAFPVNALRTLGYEAVWQGERSWNGVAILARNHVPVLTRTNLPGSPEDQQARYIEAAVQGVLITSIYLPNGNPQPGPKFNYKLAWFERLIAHAAELMASGAPVVLAGDYNVVPTPQDIYPTRSLDNNARKFAWIRGIMHLVYKHGQRHEFLPRQQEGNPMNWVSQRTTSDYTAVPMTPKQAFEILLNIPEPRRTLTLSDAATALRVSELLALMWTDLDFADLVMYVRRAYVWGRFKVPKSKASKAPVPMHPLLAGFLLAWRDKTPFGKETDFVFPSVRLKGKKPLSASIMVQKYLRPAAVKAGVIKEGQKVRFGFHNFRHALATALVKLKVDAKTVQGMLRHEDFGTTMQLYAQSDMESMREAQGKFLEQLLGDRIHLLTERVQ